MLLPSSFTDRAGLRLSVKVSALPTSPTLRFPWRSPFSRLTYGSLSLTTCRLARPPCRSGPGSHPAYGDFYIRASSGLVTRTAAGYWQLGKFHWRDLLLTPARTPTSIAATQIQDLVGIELGRANYRFTSRLVPERHGFSGFSPLTILGPPSAQSSFAWHKRYSCQGGVPHHLEGHYPFFLAPTSSCAKPAPSSGLRDSPLISRGLCRLLRAPAGN